ncbi:ras association domain-containing protein 9 [Pelodytes ibericus]
MEHEERQIVVWIGQEEKIVSGLTKHTTSAEVVKALHEDHRTTEKNSCFILVNTEGDYCIVEKWRGFERILPPSTKIWKLWKAWGKEQINLIFVLVKADTFLAVPIWRISEAKITPNLEQNHQYCATHYIKSLPLDKQKRIVKKAFRKLAKLKKEVDLQDPNNVETLIHLIISQDHTIKQQTERMHELDKEIEAFETHLHLARVENNGEKYAHNIYFDTFDSVTINSMNLKAILPLEHQNRHKKETEIEEQLKQHQIRIDSLSTAIEEEISSLYLEQNSDTIKCSDEGKKQLEDCDSESLKKELEESLQVGLKLHAQYNYVQKEIQYNDSLLVSKEMEYKNLEDDMKNVSVDKTYPSCTSSTKDYTVIDSTKAANDFSITVFNLGIYDTDSDTGISSTHSQD